MKKLLAPLILGVVGVAILLSLCFWQIQRLAWKEGLVADLNEQLAAPPVPFEALKFQDGLAVHLQGVIGEGFTNKLTGDKYQGAGYIRIVPLNVQDRVLALELGFFPQTAVVPDVDGMQVDMIARVYLPEGKGTFDAGRNLWVGYDLEGITAQLGAERAFFVPETEVAEGFAARPYRNTLPNNHAQYAITWALFALVWLAMTCYWGYARIRKEKAE